MGLQTTGTIFDAIGQVLKSAAALISQRIKGAVAKQAAERFRIRTLMAGKILAFPVLEEIIIRHITPLSMGILSAADG